jgi:FAD:protein FMN transferase
MPAASWEALGTTATVVLAEAGGLDSARTAVEEELDAIDRTCSRFRPDSELMRLGRSGGYPMRISGLLTEALGVALWAAEVTDGAVDPTIGRALLSAGYDRDFASLRPARGRLRAVAVPGWHAVELDRDTRSVRVPTGVLIDLGATAKALAADRAARAASERSGAGVLVNLGGDIAMAGPAPEGGWAVRVCEDHRAGPDDPGTLVMLHGGGLATSSVTVRRWRHGPDEAHHIIDPERGVPVSSCWRTVSVAAASCLEANVASTAAIVRGAGARERLEAQRLPARLIGRDGDIVHTGAWPAERVAA